MKKRPATISQGVWNCQPCWWCIMPEQSLGESYTNVWMQAHYDPAGAAKQASEWMAQ